MAIRKNNYLRLFRACLPTVVILMLAGNCLGQDTLKTAPDGTEGLTHIIRPGDTLVKPLPPNEFQGTYSTFKIGLGFIQDGVTYIEDDVFKQQMDSAGLKFEPKFQVRDFRLLGSGVLKTKRYIAWKFAYMYDGPERSWLVRESGVTIGVPELFGHLFVGRTKEGYSMVKVMNGHSPWGAERQMALDVIPIMADGVKWFGTLPKSTVFWNLGYFNDAISKGQGFSTFEWQADARVGFLPYYDKEKNKVLHVAANFRYGKPLDGKIVLKSRPESNPAPFIINTGTFPSDYSTHIGAEAYYSTGRLLLGSEVMVHQFNSKTSEDHNFFGGNFVVTYLFTKGLRPYTTTGSFFGFVKSQKPVFKGGWGTWEAVLHASMFDLNDGSINGGSFWRFTPMVNWYMTRIMRTEFIYGYGELDRYKLKGAVQFFQVRVQLTVM